MCCKQFLTSFKMLDRIKWYFNQLNKSIYRKRCQIKVNYIIGEWYHNSNIIALQYSMLLKYFCSKSCYSILSDVSLFCPYVPACGCLCHSHTPGCTGWVWLPLCTYPALSAGHWYVSILMCLLLASVSMFLLVTVNESTSGPFNDAGCYGNSLLLYSDGRGKEGSGWRAQRGGIGLLSVWVRYSVKCT